MKKINIGIVGLNFGKRIINDITCGDAEPYFNIAGVCDLDAERTKTISETYQVKVYSNLQEMLSDKEIPVIGLFTGPSGRAGLMNLILDAGKDIITTKPFELDADKAEEVLQKAHRLGRKIMLNSPSPQLPPDLAQITDWAKEYNLGQIVACRCDTWASYREKPNGTWYDDPQLCPVAPIFRLGIYLINDISRLMGMAQAVQVLHSRIFTLRPTPDNAQLGILFKSGAIANVFASFCIEDGQNYKNSLVLNFERGTITRNICPLTREDILRESILSLTTLDSMKNQIVKTATTKGSTDQYHWDVFYNILNGDAIPSDTGYIVNSIRIINAMKRAEQSGLIETV